MRRSPSSTDELVHLVNRMVDDRLLGNRQDRAGVGPLNGRGFSDQIGYSRYFNDPVIPGSSAVGDINPPNNFDEEGNPVIVGGLGVDPYGVDYGNWPLKSYNFGHASARLANIDYYVGVPFVTRLRARGDDGGHLHRGIDGDGPLIPLSSIVLPNGTRLNSYLGIGDATGTAPDPTGTNATPPPLTGGERFGVWDDFELEDQSDRWQIANGDVERRQEASGNWRWYLPPNSLVRVRSPGFSFNDRITIRLDVRWDLGSGQRTLEVRLRSRTGTSGFSYVAGFSATQHCYLAELDYATGVMNVLEPLPSDFAIPNDDQTRTVEVMLDGINLQAGTSDGEAMAVSLLRDDSGDEGYIELYVPPDSAGASIDNFLLARGSISMVQRHGDTHHSAGADPLDVADLADRGGILHTSAPGPHAASHETGGLDVLNLSRIPDPDSRLLTRTQVEVLTLGGDASAYHTHSTIAEVDTVSVPRPVLLGEATGLSFLAAPADHVHLLPRWKMQTYVDPGIGPGHLPQDVDFVSAPPVMVDYLPTLGGEFAWTGAGDGFVWRAWLAIANAGAADYPITLVVPVLVDMILRIRTVNDADGDLMLQTYDETDYALNASVTFRLPAGQTTSIILYGSGSGPGLKHVRVLNTEFDGDLFGSGKDLRWAPVELALGP